MSSPAACSSLQSEAAIDSPPSNRPHVRCIINNIPVSCLVDSGASITCIHPTVLHAIQRNGLTDAPELPNPNLTITSAAGTTLAASSRNSLQFVTPDGNTTIFPTFIIPDLSSQCILGTDFLKATQAKADFTNNSISFNGGHIFSLTSTTPQMDLASLETDSFPVLSCANSITIPACSSKHVATKILFPPDAKFSLVPGDAVECHGDPNLVLNGIISIGDNDSASIMCINTSTEPRLINKGDDLAHISPLPNLAALLQLLPATDTSPVAVLTTNDNAATIASMPTVSVTNASWQPRPRPPPAKPTAGPAGKARPPVQTLSSKAKSQMLRKNLQVLCPEKEKKRYWDLIDSFHDIFSEIGRAHV